MAKVVKKATKKRKSKYDITVKIPEGMTFEQLVKLAATTPIKNSKVKRK